MDATALRHARADELKQRGTIRTPAVEAAFRAVPRHMFVPQVPLEEAYAEKALITKKDAEGRFLSSCSQPAIVAIMLEQLDLRPGHRVLEIGAGTGYNAALLDRLEQQEGLEVTIDITEDIARDAAVALRELGTRAAVVVADGRYGLAGPVRFDRIEVTASSDVVPRAWHQNLVPDGRLVVPLRISPVPDSTHAVTAFRRTPDGFESVAVTPGGFMPLRPPEGGDGEVVSEEESAQRAAAHEPRQPSAPTQQADPATRHPPIVLGPPFGLGREDVSRLRIRVVYDAEPPPARWHLRRPDHWITLALP
jgi:protein-L-isoaspartate(D-aspartate) O-methyltransferase